MQQIYLNIIPNGICPRVYVNQYDIGRRIEIKFKDGTQDYQFSSGTEFKLNGRKSDNHVFEYTEDDTWATYQKVIRPVVSVSTITEVIVATTEQMTAAPGEVKVQLTYKVGASTQGTLNFIMVVQERPEASGDPSESDVPDVVRLVNGVAPDGDGDVATLWSDMSSVSNLSITEDTRTMSTIRNAGTYVYVKEDDQLYVITTTINSGGTLKPGTNATATSVGSALSTLSSELTNKQNKTWTLVSNTTVGRGSWAGVSTSAIITNYDEIHIVVNYRHITIPIPYFILTNANTSCVVSCFADPTNIADMILVCYTATTTIGVYVGINNSSSDAIPVNAYLR